MDAVTNEPSLLLEIARAIGREPRYAACANREPVGASEAMNAMLALMAEARASGKEDEGKARVRRYLSGVSSTDEGRQNAFLDSFFAMYARRDRLCALRGDETLPLVFISSQAVASWQAWQAWTHEKKHERPFSWALARLRYAAKKGHPGALTSLGAITLSGRGVPRSVGTAIAIFKMAAGMGQARAQAHLAGCCLTGVGLPPDREEAARWMTLAAQGGEVASIGRLGTMYFDGDGVPKDFTKARELWERAAALNEPESCFNLGLMYLDGHGVSPDPGKAAAIWKKAVDLGYPMAMYNLACLYMNGNGVPKSHLHAIALFEKAANRGSVLAQLAAAEAWVSGWTGKKDLPRARDWLVRAAKAGDSRAMFNLGSLVLEDGDTVEHWQKARRWWERAARLGNSQAMFNLAIVASEGKDGHRDPDRAADLWLRAANMGDTQSQTALGELYLMGAPGIPKDPKLGREWLTRAAHAGNPKAQNILSNLAKIAKIRTEQRQEDVEEPEGDTGSPDSFGNVANDAERGDPHAQLTLGVNCLLGRGVPQDSREAARWLIRAALQGTEEAVPLIVSIAHEGIDVFGEIDMIATGPYANSEALPGLLAAVRAAKEAKDTLAEKRDREDAPRVYAVDADLPSPEESGAASLDKEDFTGSTPPETESPAGTPDAAEGQDVAAPLDRDAGTDDPADATDAAEPIDPALDCRDLDDIHRRKLQ